MLKSEPVEVASSTGVEPWVEARRYLPSAFDPDLPGEEGIEGSAKSASVPAAGRNVHRRHLPVGVDPAVSPARGHHRTPGAGDLLEDGFHLALDGSLPGLHLPAVEGGSVIVDPEGEAGKIGHEVKGTGPCLGVNGGGGAGNRGGSADGRTTAWGVRFPPLAVRGPLRDVDPSEHWRVWSEPHIRPSTDH